MTRTIRYQPATTVNLSQRLVLTGPQVNHIRALALFVESTAPGLPHAKGAKETASRILDAIGRDFPQEPAKLVDLVDAAMEGGTFNDGEGEDLIEPATDGVLHEV